MGSTPATGNSRRPLRRAFATRGALLSAKGTGAPSSCRLRATLAVLSLAFLAAAIAASPASAAPPKVTTPQVSNVSYASVHVTGKITTDGSGAVGLTAYQFQISTDNTTWSTAVSSLIEGGAATNKKVEADITEFNGKGLKGGTQYFVRLTAENFKFGGPVTEATSLEPNPSFTTLTADPTEVVLVENASEISYTTAKATGKIKRPEKSDNVACHFEYITDTQFNENVGNSAPGFQGATPIGCEPEEFVAATGGEVPVSAKLKELASNTIYHLRLAVSNANNADVKEAAQPFTTLTVDPPSVISVENATGVEYTQAQVEGIVERPANTDPAFDTSCNFEYVTDEQFTTNEGNSEPLFTGATPVACEGENPITTNSPPGSTPVKATLGGLAASTTYHLRLAVSNKGGSDAKEAAATFTTNGPIPAPTITAANDATDVSYSTAKASGTVERPAGADPALNVNCRFEYITDKQFNDNVANIGPGAGFEGANAAYCAEPITTAGSTPVSAELTELLSKSGVTYHLRLVAENAAGIVTKDATNTFTTLPGGEPSLIPDPNPVMGYTTARASAVVERGLDGSGQTERLVAVLFQYAELGTENWIPACGCTSPEVEVEQVAGPQTVTLEFSGLKPGTAYEFRWLLMGDFNGFDTGPLPPPYPTATTKGTNTPPTATLDPITTFTGAGAHFAGTVSANSPGGLDAEGKAAYKTEWHFECTPECPGPGGEPFSGSVQAEEGSKAISADVIRLHANTFYEVKLVAHNVLGTVETPIQTFQTPLVLPDLKSEAGGSDGEGGYTIQGVIDSNNSKLTNCEFAWGPNSGEEAKDYAFKAPCLPFPSTPDEVQNVNIDATEGQFKLTFRGQTTGDLPYNATAAEVQTALRALSSIGAAGVTVAGSPGAYEVTFAGKLAGANVEQLNTAEGTTPLGGGAGASVSTATGGGTAHPVTVEAHLPGLNPGSVYHFRIVATNAAGDAKSTDRAFTPTLSSKEPCPNEALRKESGSLALPECRAYELVTAGVDSEGNSMKFLDFYGDDTAAYLSGASNIANSGLGDALSALGEGYNTYVARRTAAGWETIPNLNGPPGASPLAPPESMREFGAANNTHYSADFLSSIWVADKQGDPAGPAPYLRKPDGSFHRVGNLNPTDTADGEQRFGAASADLSHVVYESRVAELPQGPGVYEFVGTGNDQPRRVDVDNSGTEVSSAPCGAVLGDIHAHFNSISLDGSTIVFSVCGGPGGGEVWARVNATTSFDVSASHCDRVAPACNAPAKATFAAATPDGSRVFFTTAQQLVNGDTDETNDLYACDLPSAPQAPVGSGNPCSALTEVSGAASEARVESVLNTSEDGSTVYFFAKGVLADNKDALEETATAGDHNLYVWRVDAAHPGGQTTFVGRMGNVTDAQSAFDGRYLVLNTSDPLVPTDTDSARDVYRYDAVTGEMTRVSTGIFGTGGNGEGFDAAISPRPVSGGETLAFTLSPAISAAGDRIVFTTKERLSPLDGNEDTDVYLWSSGHVYLISGGSVGNGGTNAAIDDSGRDIYFNNGDFRILDARIGGGFTNPPPACFGESCQPPAPTPPSLKGPGSGQPSSGNPPQPKPCPKGKVKKHGKCLKKHTKGQKHKKSHKKAGHNRGGSK